MNGLMRSLVLALGIALLSASLSLAQESDGEDSLMHRFSAGIFLGPSVPLRKSGLGDSDPYTLVDNAPLRMSMAITCSYRLTPAIALEGSAEVFSMASLDRAQKEHAEAAYPDEHLVTSSINHEGAIGVGGGLSYRISLGPFSLEPSLFLYYLQIDSIPSSVLLKKKGANEYRSIAHRVAVAKDVAIVPTVTIRLPFTEDAARWGAILRASYIRASFDVEHILTESNLKETPHVESFTARHTLDMLNLQIGIYHNLFCSCE